MDQQHYPQVYQTHSGSVYQSVENRNPWQTGHFRRLPIAGLLAILGAIIGIGACAGILVASDGKPVADWKFQPTVYLAIAATLTNIFLAFALSEGADIAWWRKASSDKTTVADLHRIWAHGKGFKDALLAGRKTSLVAVACIFATIAQINSPLLQKASTVVLADVTTNIQISFRAATQIPDGFTGFTSGRGYDPSMFRSQYVDTVLKWNNNASIPANGTGCSSRGVCRANVIAMGLALDCSSAKKSFNLNPNVENGQLVTTDPAVQGIDVFRSTFTFSRGSSLTLNVTYKDTPACQGDLIIQECALQAAKISYPVIIDGNKSTIALDWNTTIYNDTVQELVPIAPENRFGPTTFGGYYLALQNKYFSNATMRFTGAVPYTILTKGNTALQYVVSNDDDFPYQNCSTHFRDPMTNILDGARELMFRTSIAAGDFQTPIQKVDATQFESRPVYKSNYYYLGGAMAITIVATVAILTIFRGYSDLGRNPTMSPIEIAKAFNAPILQSHDGNAEADDLIRDVGMRSVKYGAVYDASTPMAPPGFNPNNPTDYKPYNPHVQEVGMNARRRLLMGDATQVDKPQTGETFTG